MRPHALALAALVALLANQAHGQITKEKAPPGKGKAKVESVAGYKKHTIDGFTVNIHEDVLKQDASKFQHSPVEVLELELKNITKLMTKKQADGLRAGVPVWVDWDVKQAMINGRGGYAAGVYMGVHPRPIVANGKEFYVSGVRIFRMDSVMSRYAKETDLPPDNLLLHEFVHAVHDLVFGGENPQIKDAYRQAMERNLYDKTEYVSTNDKEFFAELSCAYLAGVTRYYPHNRAELKKHDPVTYKLMESLWGKKTDTVTKGKNPEPRTPDSKFDLAVTLDSLKWGKQIGGRELKPEEDLSGRVVVAYYWATFIPESLAGLAKLAQLHDELNDFGLVTVAAHGPGGSELRFVDAKEPPTEEMKSVARSRGVTYPLFDTIKSDQLNDARKLPHAAVFAPSGKCVFRGDPFAAAEAARVELGKALVAGAGREKFTGGTAALARALEEGQPPAAVLPKLLQVFRGSSGAAGGDARALIGQMTAQGQKRFEQAESMLKSDPVAAFVILDRITTVFKNTQLAGKASERLNTLKIHTEVKAELRVKPSMDTVRKLDTTLSGKPQSFDPTLAEFQRDNAALLQQLRDAVEKVRKTSPRSKAAEEATFIAEKYAVKLR